MQHEVSVGSTLSASRALSRSHRTSAARVARTAGVERRGVAFGSVRSQEASRNYVYWYRLRRWRARITVGEWILYFYWVGLGGNIVYLCDFNLRSHDSRMVPIMFRLEASGQATVPI